MSKNRRTKKGHGAPLSLDNLTRLKGTLIIQQGGPWHGLHAQAWPRRRGPPTSPITREQNTEFRTYSRMPAQMPADQQVAARALAVGTSYTWRDILSRLIIGRFVTFPRGRMDDIQDLLDTITDEPGSMLVRTLTAWIGLGPGLPGQALFAAGAGVPPGWQDLPGVPGQGPLSGAIIPPPPLSSGLWTLRNIGGTATATDTPYGPVITSGDLTGEVRGMDMPAPATPYVIDALIAMPAANHNFVYNGLYWTDGTKLVRHGFSGNFTYRLQNWTNNTTWSGDVRQMTLIPSGQFWWRLSDDGTNWKVYISADGTNWWQVQGGTKASGYLGSTGYSRVGWFTATQEAGLSTFGNMPASLQSWLVH